MIIKISEYAKRNGRPLSTVQMYARTGRLKTAHKQDGIWCVDEDEPCPPSPHEKTGKYKGWRSRYPIKNPGRMASRKRARPIRDIYVVLKSGHELVNGLYLPKPDEALFVSYGLEEAHSAYSDALSSSVETVPRPYIRVVGYRVHCEKTDTAEQAYMGAIDNDELQDRQIFYILDQENEYLRPSRRKLRK